MPQAAPAPALPHGSIRELLPDVFLVSGQMAMSGPVAFSRNMTILRQGGELTLVNSVRLSEQGLSELERLGKVAHVIRLAGFHGRDDAFYKEKYGARVACIKGQKYSRGFKAPTPQDIYFEADAQLDASSALPVDGARLHLFGTKPPEALLLLERQGGTIVSGDSMQNWATTDEYFSLVARGMMRLMGFIKPANVGPGWLKQARPPAADLAAVMDLSFRNVLPAHGAPVLGGAKEAFRPAFDRAIALASKA